MLITYVVMESNYIKEFHQYLITVCDSIKFTREEEHEESLQTTVFRKAMHGGRYLPFSSHHPLQQKLSIPQTRFS